MIKRALLMAGMVGIGAALGLGLKPPVVHADTGSSVMQDFLCIVPAYAAMHDKDGKCDGVKNPADYGSGFDIQEPDPSEEPDTP